MDAVKMLGALLNNNATGGNVLGSLLKGAMGGGNSAQGGPMGGSQQSGGISNLIGGLLGGGRSSTNTAPSGGGILGTLLQTAMQNRGGAAVTSGGSAATGLLAQVIGSAIGSSPEVTPDAHQQANDQATVLIRAMCNAAKADGQIDDQEQQYIMDRLGSLDQDEREFLQRELAAPLDVASFVASVPKDLAAETYTLSVMTIKVDTPQEAQYLTQLAQGLGLDQDTVATIHQQIGIA